MTKSDEHTGNSGILRSEWAFLGTALIFACARLSSEAALANFDRIMDRLLVAMILVIAAGNLIERYVTDTAWRRWLSTGTSISAAACTGLCLGYYLPALLGRSGHPLIAPGLLLIRYTRLFEENPNAFIAANVLFYAIVSVAILLAIKIRKKHAD